MNKGGNDVDLVNGLLAKLFSRRNFQKRSTLLERVRQPRGQRIRQINHTRQRICTLFSKCWDRPP